MKPKRIPRAVLAKAAKKAGTFGAFWVRRALGRNGFVSGATLSSCVAGLDHSLRKRATVLYDSGFHYSPYKFCDELAPSDFVECWSGDVNNPTVRRHKVGNCRVEV